GAADSPYSPKSGMAFRPAGSEIRRMRELSNLVRGLSIARASPLPFDERISLAHARYARFVLFLAGFVHWLQALAFLHSHHLENAMQSRCDSGPRRERFSRVHGETMNTNIEARRDWLGLADRVCVVTGAGSGIGAAIAEGLVDAGARVALVDRDGAAA